MPLDVTLQLVEQEGCTEMDALGVELSGVHSLHVFKHVCDPNKAKGIPDTNILECKERQIHEKAGERESNLFGIFR